MIVNKNKSKLNILHLIVGLGDGGAEATLYKLVSTDNKNNHIVISLSDFGKYGELLSKKNIPVYALNFRRNRFNFLQIFKLLNKIEKFNPEIIQSWMYHADFLTSIIKLFYPKKLFGE